jgi:hypothetical protein
MLRGALTALMEILTHAEDLHSFCKNHLTAFFDQKQASFSQILILRWRKAVSQRGISYNSEVIYRQFSHS